MGKPGRPRKPGRPKGSKTKYTPIYGCERKVTVYRRQKGRIQGVRGYKHRACLD